MMDAYKPQKRTIWKGRTETFHKQAYWHQIVRFLDLSDIYLDQSVYKENTPALLGYACDEGVKRNQGRSGASSGPKAIRKLLGGLPNHNHTIIDAGNIRCIKNDMELAQSTLSDSVERLLKARLFPILLGGGHDIAYGHYSGIRNYIASINPNAQIGIINLDAHFDLRANTDGNTSGTPFYQIAQDCKTINIPFHYLCLGIQESSNPQYLFDTANKLEAEYMLSSEMNMQNIDRIRATLSKFMDKVDYIYLTIDLDGFSSAYAPGVSAPSPVGFSPEIALQTIEHIKLSKKLISADIAEMNPVYDIDNHTTRLAAKLIYALT